MAGSVVEPTDLGTTQSPLLQRLIDHRPAVIVRCTGVEDIGVAFDFARTHGLEVAVRGGGHNPAGHCVCDDGLVIDLSTMRDVVVDRESRTAQAQGGATWFDFDSATQAAGLVTPVASSARPAWPGSRSEEGSVI